MDDFRPSSYGDAIADVYDDWYGDVSDAEATVEGVVELLRPSAAPARILELGVGTGRLAIPLAQRGLDVTGIDVSAAMVERLRAKPGGDRVRVVVGDMADELPAGPFDVVFVAFNTFFGLTDAAAQARCFAAVAVRLAREGTFALEAFVPDEDITGGGDRIEVRTLDADRVVLTVSRHDHAAQRASGQFIELTEAGGVRLRPWSLRYTTPAQLDAMAADAGLVLDGRWSSWRKAPFTPDSSHHVTLYRHGGSRRQ